MNKVFMLDSIGLAVSLVIGIIIFSFGGMYGLNLLILLVIFLVLSVLVSKYDTLSKKTMNIYENERGWKNVLSNGIVPTILIVLYYFTGNFLFIYAYFGSVASITADKFGSELGVFDTPYFLLGFKQVIPGTSGAISVLGTFASLSGAFLIGLSAVYLFNLPFFSAFLIGMIGLIGCFTDSIFGVLEEKGIGNKFTTNFICSIIGGVLGFVLF